MTNNDLNLYHLKRLDEYEFDRLNEIVVIASSADKARREAAGEEPDHEVRDHWFNEAITSCRVVGVASPGMEPGYVMLDVNWG